MVFRPAPAPVRARQAYSLWGRDDRAPLRPPSEAYPLLDVVGHRRPQRFQCDVRDPAHTKLAQTELRFDPEIGKLRNLRPRPIDRACVGCLHFLSEGRDRRERFDALDRTSAARARTAEGFREPPSACRMTRASGSVVLTRSTRLFARRRKMETHRGRTDTPGARCCSRLDLVDARIFRSASRLRFCTVERMKARSIPASERVRARLTEIM